MTRREENEWDVDQEIDYLSKLTGVPCWQFRHEIMSGNALIPATVLVVVAAMIDATLDIIDVTTPAAPTLESTVATGLTSGNDDALYITGNTAFNLGDDDKLYVIDITNKAAPVILSSPACPRAGSGFYRMIKTGNFLAILRSNNVPAAQNTLAIWDVTNLAAPVLLHTYDLMADFAAKQNGGSILLDGTTAWIAGDTGAPGFSAAIGAYDFSALPVVTQTAVTVTDGAGTELDFIDLQAHFGYTISETATLEIRIYNLTNPLLPVLTGFLNIGASNIIIFSPVSNGTIYGITLFATDIKIHPYDVSNPLANPVALATTTPAGVVNRNFSINAGKDAAGFKVYVANRENAGFPRNRKVQIYDATVPAALAFVGEVIYAPLAGNAQLQLAYG